MNIPKYLIVGSLGTYAVSELLENKFLLLIPPSFYAFFRCYDS